LPGINTDVLKVSSHVEISESVDVVLQIAEVNLSIYMANLVGKCDLFVPEGTQNLLMSKLVRSGIDINTLNNFIQLLDLNNLPDPGIAIISGDITLGDIWKIREKRVSKKFRRWLQTSNTDDARDLERLYVESLGKDSTFNSLPVKIIRFALTTSASIINPVIGLGLDVVDSFFVDKWLHGYSPVFFLDQLNDLYGVKSIERNKKTKGGPPC